MSFKNHDEPAKASQALREGRSRGGREMARLRWAPDNEQAVETQALACGVGLLLCLAIRVARRGGPNPSPPLRPD